MKPRRLTAKGVSTSSRRKSARLALLPRRRHLDHETRLRLWRGFITVEELNFLMEDAK